MNIPREVIVDLLPLYLAGEVSPQTRALVEEHLRSDPELERRVRDEMAATAAGKAGRLPGLAGLPTGPAARAVEPPPEIEMRSLRRTRRMLGLLRWLFALGLTFTLLSFSFQISFRGSHMTSARLLLWDYPALMGIGLGMGVGCLTAYFLLRRRLRADASPGRLRRS